MRHPEVREATSYIFPLPSDIPPLSCTQPAAWHTLLFFLFMRNYNNFDSVFFIILSAATKTFFNHEERNYQENHSGHCDHPDRHCVILRGSVVYLLNVLTVESDEKESPLPLPSR